MIKSFIDHTKWFNRKSQFYIFGNWVCYLNRFEDGYIKSLLKYYKQYPIAYCKFIWFSRIDILQGRFIDNGRD